MTTEFLMTTEDDRLIENIERVRAKLGGLDLLKVEGYIISNPQDVFGYVSKAMVLTGEKKYQQAHECISDAKSKFPNSGVLFHINATVYETEGKREEAVKESKTAVRLNPYSPEIRITLGTLLHRAKKFDEAIAAWEDMLKIDPSAGFAWNSLARAEFEKGDYRRAINHSTSAVMLSEGSSLYYTFLQNRSQIYIAKGDLESALRDDGEILAHDIQAGLNHIGTQPQYLIAHRRENEAREYMQKAIERFPVIRSFLRR